MRENPAGRYARSSKMNVSVCVCVCVTDVLNETEILFTKHNSALPSFLSSQTIWTRTHTLTQSQCEFGKHGQAFTDDVIGKHLADDCFHMRRLLWLPEATKTRSEWSASPPPTILLLRSLCSPSPFLIPSWSLSFPPSLFPIQQDSISCSPSPFVCRRRKTFVSF